MSTSSEIKARFLIISDTHGARLFESDEAVRTYGRNRAPSRARGGREGDAPLFTGFRRPLPKADVAIHCGDLTYRSTVAEFEAAFELLREVDAPLKLVIPGNHDDAMDTAFWAAYRGQVGTVPGSSVDQDRPARVREVVERAHLADPALRVLAAEQGTYHFVLGNGARLRAYTSPMTPAYGWWSFQFDERYDFRIPEPTAYGVAGSDQDTSTGGGKVDLGVDVVISHGPPKGVLDRTSRGDDAGSPDLLLSVARARPRLHCFGHIHEGWGAKLLTWRDEISGTAASIYTSISSSSSSAADAGAHLSPADLYEEDSSVVIEDLQTLGPAGEDDSDTAEGKRLRHNQIAEDRGRLISLGAGEDGLPAGLEPGKQTLFVNAAIMSLDYRPFQLPWVVDLDLPRATEEDQTRAALASG